jgi:hypothetical protein
MDINSSRLQDNRSAAFHWYGYGLKVIPVIPGKKQTAVKWDTWFEGYSSEAINDHWTAHPDHEVGCIVGDDLIVLDADSPESIEALNGLEQRHGLTPHLVNTTSRGEHHYFRRAEGSHAKSDAHSTEAHPERIDVKTGRALVVLPPSGGRQVKVFATDDVDMLSVADQAVIDAIFRHNGRDAPRAQTSSQRTPPADPDQTIAQLNAMLQHLDPDSGYQDWLHVLMAVYHGTGGSEQGFALVNAWSSQGQKYRGEAEIRTKWSSFEHYDGTPITVGTIIKLLAAKGVDWIKVCAALEPPFKVRDDKVIPEVEPPPAEDDHPLSRYSLTGKSEFLEQEAVKQKPLLGNLALLGQSTVFYGAPNTGKTLEILWLLSRAIEAGIIDPSSIYYIDVDDSQAGVVEKLRLAEQHGFHLLAEGNCGFRASQLLNILNDLISTNRCKGVVIILDTLKKFTDVMDKHASTEFSKVIRRFVMRGGTCISLAHVNKNTGADGRPVYAGTSDIIEDADCAYTLRVIDNPDPQLRIVEFENLKRRGNVCQRATYGYSNVPGLSYSDLLQSVRPIDEAEMASINQSAALNADAGVIEAVSACILDGIVTKMQLADAAAARAGVSRRMVLKVIERYTDDDPLAHRWTYRVRDRGAKVFELLTSSMVEV